MQDYQQFFLFTFKLRAAIPQENPGSYLARLSIPTQKVT
jgi:hypothetical protein